MVREWSVVAFDNENDVAMHGRLRTRQKPYGMGGEFRRLARDPSWKTRGVGQVAVRNTFRPSAQTGAPFVIRPHQLASSILIQSRCDPRGHARRLCNDAQGPPWDRSGAFRELPLCVSCQSDIKSAASAGNSSEPTRKPGLARVAALGRYPDWRDVIARRTRLVVGSRRRE